LPSSLVFGTAHRPHYNREKAFPFQLPHDRQARKKAKLRKLKAAVKKQLKLSAAQS